MVKLDMHNDKQFFNYTFSIKKSSDGEIDLASPRESIRSNKTQPTFEMTPGYKPFTKCFTWKRKRGVNKSNF